MSKDRIRKALDAAENHAPLEAGGSYAAQMAQDDLESLLRENNALRRNNERLTRENAALAQRAREAEASARTGQAMAAHWRLKAEPQSGDYDATREEAP